MKIIFFGCDDFALVCLNRLVDDGVQVAALVTQPDKPQGRGLHIMPSPTKEFAVKASLDVFQPVNLREPAVIERLRGYGADIYVVVAYGKFLPDELLALPRLFAVNVHPSLLPKYRGAAPVNWAIINGDEVTGVTLIKVSAAMDGGDILAQEEYPLSREVSSAQLRADLAVKGADLLARTLPLVMQGEHRLCVQDSTRSTRAPKMPRELGHIDWTKPAVVIHNLVRGTQPWPGAFTAWHGQMVKILETALPVQGAPAAGRPGSVTAVSRDGLVVQTGDGQLLIKKVHPANSKAMDARAFSAGHRIGPGDILG